MKRILIDATCVRSTMDGLSQYILNIIKNMLLIKQNDIEYTILLCSSKQLSKADLEHFTVNMKILYIDIPKIGWKRDFMFYLYLKKKRKEYDFFYFPSNQYPLFFKGGIYTVHDVIYERFPQQLGRLSKLKRLYLHLNVRWGLHHADRVVAVSNYTKSELIKYHHLSVAYSAKIEVVYEGWEHLLCVENRLFNNIDAFDKYFFYVGSSRKHKNLSNLLKAFSLILDRMPNEWGLIIAGESNRLSEKDKKEILNINSGRRRVILTEWISDVELSCYFQKASAFIFPSLSEGFGIPLLEAFYYHVPILCSDNTVFPEIAGDAALYFNPLDPNSIAAVMLDYTENEMIYKSRMQYKGDERLLLYSWRHAAEAVLQIIINSKS